MLVYLRLYSSVDKLISSSFSTFELVSLELNFALVLAISEELYTGYIQVSVRVES